MALNHYQSGAIMTASQFDARKYYYMSRRGMRHPEIDQGKHSQLCLEDEGPELLSRVCRIPFHAEKVYAEQAKDFRGVLSDINLNWGPSFDDMIQQF